MSRILIVEDEPHLAQGLRFNLEAEGHAVEIVESGEGALRLLLEDKKTFDAVILDIMLPATASAATAVKKTIKSERGS